MNGIIYFKTLLQDCDFDKTNLLNDKNLCNIQVVYERL